MIYRKAIPDDAKQCIDIRGKTRQNALSVEQLATFGITYESWAQGILEGDFYGYICEIDGLMAGYCFGDTKSGEILVLVVLPQFENLGLGRELLNRVVIFLKNKKFNKLFLYCSPYPESRSYGFYRRLGWLSTGKIDNDEELLELFFTQ
ncbi:MAG: ribosomal protein S18 acetylase RimI-like enzyme [Paraglaciecola sp.]|jgi:ribosomal protein S18 acetylase RimI-like enzyme